MKPKVSIIVPVYNTEKYLNECLNSLINQTLTDIEIVCVNDGSTDNSLGILEKFAQNDKRVKVINQENSGQSSARNTGINSAIGEYIGFIDSDDYAKPQMFEKLYKQAVKTSSDIVISSITVMNEQTKQFDDYDPYMSIFHLFGKKLENRVFNHFDCSHILFRICVTPWNKLYKSDFLKQNNIKFVENLNFEDNVFCIETLLNAKKISILKEPLVVYRKASSTSYTFFGSDKKKLDFFRVFEHEERLLKEKGLYSFYKENFEFHKKTILKYWYSKIKDRKVKSIYGLKLFALYPFDILETIKDKIQIIRTRKKLQKEARNNKILVWGSSLYAKQIVKNLKNSVIAGFVDVNANEEMQSSLKFPLYKVCDLQNFKGDNLKIAAISKNYYSYDKIVEDILEENNLNIPVEKF